MGAVEFRMATKRSYTPKRKTPARRVPVKTEPEKKAVLVINRFNAYCLDCMEHMHQDTKTCPTCGVVFLKVTTGYTCKWMNSTVKATRPDLEYVLVTKYPEIRLII